MNVITSVACWCCLSSSLATFSSLFLLDALLDSDAVLARDSSSYKKTENLSVVVQIVLSFILKTAQKVPN